MIVAFTTLAIVIAVAGLAIWIGVICGRLVVKWSGPPLIRVRRFEGAAVALESTPLTRHVGTYGLRSPRGHARIGRVLSEDGRTVVREVEAVSGEIQTASRAAFEGDVHATPGEVGDYVDLDIATPTGFSPAWQFGAGTDTWVIHIHGLQADRNNALRSVAALHDLAATHLVISYRGDGDGPPVPARAARLGLSEWEDADAAVSYAVRHGAKRVLLCGWSMGATIALLLGQRSPHRDLIAGQVLVSPATDWIAAMETSAKRMGFPFARTLARYTAWFLATPALCRLVGLAEPIDFNELSWSATGCLQAPTLVVHSPGDLTVPIEATRRFADAHRALVTFYESPNAPHGLEYNVDDRVSLAINRWVRDLIG